MIERAEESDRMCTKDNRYIKFALWLGTFDQASVMQESVGGEQKSWTRP